MIGTSRLEQWERDCLLFNPFEGDRDVNVRVVRDGFLVTRTPHTCSVCAEQIAAHNITRARTEVCDGQMGTFYFCQPCCRAMAAVVVDGNDSKPIEARYHLGYENCQRAEARRKGGPR